ncbi:hypothetical protein MAPG_05856 [Magnaporthiopsis poae ATCC 64411]|uniref:Uncharacterized protein n=1 Tax=Magnaporthiopsis poae (strain ATCC 64411 / 73-15) TaxID=644358 RepID=A0A0C4E0I1_MAGP6|nr:hypothetical protein MAPG_05856 [Magnaporthiopsis poae ATCC 64411]
MLFLGPCHMCKNAVRERVRFLNGDVCRRRRRSQPSLGEHGQGRNGSTAKDALRPHGSKTPRMRVPGGEIWTEAEHAKASINGWQGRPPSRKRLDRLMLHRHASPPLLPSAAAREEESARRRGAKSRLGRLPGSLARLASPESLSPPNGSARAQLPAPSLPEIATHRIRHDTALAPPDRPLSIPDRKPSQVGDLE